MSVPQKEKEGPASMLRAMFAGVGSVLSVVDKVRRKPAAEAPANVETPATAAAAPTAPAATADPEPVVEPEASVAETATPEETAAPEPVVAETATPEETAAPEPVVAETATPEETAAPETVTPETVTPETVTPETVTPETSAELPLANYDESTVASLRARLRNLSVEQLTQLIEYEKGNAARPDVISMFERRIAKVESEA